ncbi:MAG: hypothetical protein AAB393_10405 [Bacteroidota bacterium]
MTRAITTIINIRVPIVTGFTCFDNAVSTDRTRTRQRTTEITAGTVLINAVTADFGARGRDCRIRIITVCANKISVSVGIG